MAKRMMGCLEWTGSMLSLRKDLLAMLRVKARQGEQPSVMLRALIAQLGSEKGDRPLWVRYFSTAFCFSNGQGYKIFGWFPDGTGALSDSALDSLLFPRIQEARVKWDKVDGDQGDRASHADKPNNADDQVESLYGNQRP